MHSLVCHPFDNGHTFFMAEHTKNFWCRGEMFLPLGELLCIFVICVFCGVLTFCATFSREAVSIFGYNFCRADSGFLPLVFLIVYFEPSIFQMTDTFRYQRGPIFSSELPLISCYCDIFSPVCGAANSFQ